MVYYSHPFSFSSATTTKIALLVFCVLFILSPHVSAQLDYVGDLTCKKCHNSEYKSYLRTGHPYKIQKLAGSAPTYPNGTSPGVPNPPEGLNWDDLSYVIGGYAWKARFMDKEGYILTGDTQRQYNLPNAHLKKDTHWTGYDAKKSPRKPYTCGECHTTGWVPTGEKGPHQDGLPGIHGTWAQPGVTCEGCHGAGSKHVADPETAKLSVEERCGDCHKRGEVTQIDASGGLVKHHEQYEDLLASPHKALKCIACHEPHKSVKYGGGGYRGPKKTCLSCHAQQTVKLETEGHRSECISCHMPRTAKSAVAVKHQTAEGEIPEGDVRGHVFRISLDSSWNMFTEDGKFMAVDEDRKAWLSLDRACLVCHQDKTKAWASEFAKKVH